VAEKTTKTAVKDKKQVVWACKSKWRHRANILLRKRGI